MVRAAGRGRGKKKGGGRNSVLFREPVSAALLFPFYAPFARTIPQGTECRSGIPSVFASRAAILAFFLCLLILTVNC